MLIEKKKRIGYTMYIRSGAIWPKIARRNERRKNEVFIWASGPSRTLY